MVKTNTNKTVKISANNVQLTTKKQSGSNLPGTSQSVNTRNQRRARRQNLKSRRVDRDSSPIPRGLDRLESELNEGTLANDGLSAKSLIQRVKNETCTLDDNELGWATKYLDPAGSVETGRAIGEFSKIPDGMLPWSVDAEPRMIQSLEVPGDHTEGELPDFNDGLGKVWSLVIFSFPCFRTNAIVAANKFSKSLSDEAAADLAKALNNLPDYRQTIDEGKWIPFALFDAGWYFKILPIPANYDLPTPVDGSVRTVDSWRMAYKSITIEHNAPTLVDQGWTIGANYGLEPTPIGLEPPEVELRDAWIYITRKLDATPATAEVQMIGVPAVPVVTQLPGNYIHFTVGVGVAPATFNLPIGYTMYDQDREIFADPLDLITVTRTASAVIYNSDRPGTGPLTFNTSGTALNQPVAYPYFLQGEQLNRLNVGTTIDFPAYRMDEIATNNPKCEQFQLHDSGGLYLVHKKMRNPVFQLTPAKTFGPLQFTCPGYNPLDNNLDGSGILDTIDRNFSIGVCVIMGIAHANVLILKTYMGWEGQTNNNTPIGQFGHSGLRRNDHLLVVLESINSSTTGVYKGNDNFLGTVAKFATSLLGSIFKHQATVPMLQSLAHGAIDRGITAMSDRMHRMAM